MTPPNGLLRAGSAAGHLAALAMLVWFQEVGARLRREEPTTWWAGTGRDLLNALGFAAIGAALRLGGWSGPAATLCGGLESLAVFGVSAAAARTRGGPGRLGLAGGLSVGLPALLWPEEVAAGLGAVAELLFRATAGP